jgi:hypothetical protein
MSSSFISLKLKQLAGNTGAVEKKKGAALQDVAEKKGVSNE